MMGGVAEWERRVIGERTKAALAVKKAQGTRLGGPVTTPQPIRARVAAQINGEGLRTQAGTYWSKSGVQRLVDGLRLDAEAAAAAG